jgi:hypothetical protein
VSEAREAAVTATVAPAAAPPATAGTREVAWIGLFVLLKLAVQALGMHSYGYFRDELYYLICARHLAWGYVDQPPFSIAVLALTTHLIGSSLLAIRIVPALFGAACVGLTGWITRSMGGGRFAQALAMTAVIAAPVHLAIAQYYSMNAIELLLWPLAATALARALARRGTRDWLLFGLALALGLLNKISMLWFVFGAGVGLLLSRERRVLAGPGPWLALALAIALQLPHALWQAAHGWPMLEFMRGAAGGKMVAVGVLDFVRSQVLLMNPLAAPLWITGLIVLLRARRDPADRVQGVLFATVAVILIAAGKSRASYLSPAYPVLFAAGAAAFERAFSSGWRRVLRPAAIGLIALGGLALLPLALPMLPEAAFVGYLERLGLRAGGEEHHRYGELPQQYADMHGWRAMADTVGSVVATLSAEDRAHAVIYAQNYGEASAVNFFRPDLPPCVSGHNNYWLWGPGPPGTTLVVILGGRSLDHLRSFVRVDSVAMFHAPWVMPYEDSLGVFVCREPRAPIPELWKRTRNYN